MKLLCNYEDLDKLHNLRTINKRKKTQKKTTIKPNDVENNQHFRNSNRGTGMMEDMFSKIKQRISLENINQSIFSSFTDI